MGPAGDLDETRHLDCEQPGALVCRRCGVRRAIPCGSARSDRCQPCGLSHRSRVERVARSGGLVVTTGAVFLTVTAPGDRVHYRNGVRCTCTSAGGVDLAEWNASLTDRWRRLVIRLKRVMGHTISLDGPSKGGRKTRLVEARVSFLRCTEVQRRGALHVHAIMRRDDGVPFALDPATLRAAALAEGFGHEVDVTRVEPHHYSYVAKYASKSASARQSVPWRRWVADDLGLAPDPATGELLPVLGPLREDRVSTSPTYRTWSGSRTWGLLMRDVRAAQAHYAATVAVMPRWGEDGVASVPRYWSTLGAPSRAGPGLDDLDGLVLALDPGDWDDLCWWDAEPVDLDGWSVEVDELVTS